MLQYNLQLLEIILVGPEWVINMSKFDKLKTMLAEKGASNPAGLAAFIGRKKLGKKKFQHKAELGKEKAEKKK